MTNEVEAFIILPFADVVGAIIVGEGHAMHVPKARRQTQMERDVFSEASGRQWRC